MAHLQMLDTKVSSVENKLHHTSESLLLQRDGLCVLLQALLTRPWRFTVERKGTETCSLIIHAEQTELHLRSYIHQQLSNSFISSRTNSHSVLWRAQSFINFDSFSNFMFTDGWLTRSEGTSVPASVKSSSLSTTTTPFTLIYSQQKWMQNSFFFILRSKNKIKGSDDGKYNIMSLFIYQQWIELTEIESCGQS